MLQSLWHIQGEKAQQPVANRPGVSTFQAPLNYTINFLFEKFDKGLQ